MMDTMNDDLPRWMAAFRTGAPIASAPDPRPTLAERLWRRLTRR